MLLMIRSIKILRYHTILLYATFQNAAEGVHKIALFLELLIIILIFLFRQWKFLNGLISGATSDSSPQIKYPC